MGMRAAPAATMLLIGLVGALGEASAQYYPAPSPRNYPAPTYRQVPPVEIADVVPSSSRNIVG